MKSRSKGQFSKRNRALQTGCTAVWVYSVHWAVHLQTIKMVYVMLCVFFHNFFLKKGKTKHRHWALSSEFLSGAQEFTSQISPQGY